MIKIKKLIKSFSGALEGFQRAVKTEQNFKIQLGIAILTLVVGVIFQLKIWEWIIIILLIFCVLILELFNSIVERLLDVFKPRIHDYVKEIKDIMATVVLLAAICSVVVGLLIFLPYIINIFK